MIFIRGKQYLKFNDIPSSLLQGMRIAVMNSNELYFYDVEAHSDHFDKIISIRNEREMWRTLISKLTSLLDNIGDTAHVFIICLSFPHIFSLFWLSLLNTNQIDSISDVFHCLIFSDFRCTSKRNSVL